jgi:hypothetical protein
MDLKEIEWGGIDWIDPTYDRDQWNCLSKSVMNLRVPTKSWRFLNSCTTGGFLRRFQLQ